MPLSRSMSGFLMVSSAATAALSAGMASARSASHSSFISLACGRHLADSLLLLGHHRLLRLDHLLDFLVNDDLHLLGLRLGRDQLRLERRQLLLHDDDRLARRREAAQGRCRTACGPVDLLALARKQRLEGLDQLEVRGGRHVDLAPLLSAELVAEHADGLVEDLAHFDRRLPMVLLHRDLLEESGRDGVERVGGPGAEPVDGAAVDERREHAQPRAEGVADGRHGEADVQQRAAAGDEVGKQRRGRAVALGAFLARDVAHLIADLRLLVVGEEVGHLARVEQAVDVLQVGLLLDLGVGRRGRRSACPERRPCAAPS